MSEKPLVFTFNSLLIVIFALPLLSPPITCYTTLMEHYWVRGIRGATTVARDEPELILEATGELLETMLRENGVTEFEPIASIFFTTTPDLCSTFPAEAARRLGMNMVPLNL